MEDNHKKNSQEKINNAILHGEDLTEAVESMADGLALYKINQERVIWLFIWIITVVMFVGYGIENKRKISELQTKLEQIK